MSATPSAAQSQADALHRQGLQNYQAGHPLDAIRLIQQAVRLNPDEPVFRANAASILLDLGQAEAAADQARRALALAPNFAEAANNLGNALLALGRHAEAETALRRALDLKPGYRAARFNLANLTRERGHPEEAIALYRSLLAEQPADPGAQCNLGLALEAAGRADEAIAAYRAAAAQQPDLAAAHHNLGLLLQRRHRFAEALAAFRAAVAAAPGHAAAHFGLGQCARELNDHAAALAAFDKAVALEPGNADHAAARSAYLATQIPAWHLPMLADTARNEAFAAAIAKAAPHSALTLDIGTGSGLLAMLAARAGAARVAACEAHPMIAATAREIIAANGLGSRIDVIAKRSTDLAPGELPGRADLVLAEVLDAGLLGEGILPTMRDALARLAKPDARVIPAGATLIAQAVHLPDLRQVNPLRGICGFDLSAFDKFRNRAAHGNLRLEHEPHAALSPPTALLAIDFSAPPDWSRPETRPVALPIATDGMAQAIVFWFDLRLDETITLSTGPGGAMRHWGQAICWLPRDIAVCAGDMLPLTLTLADTYFEFAPA